MLPRVEWREVKADLGWFIGPKEGEEFSQGLTSPIVLVLDFDRYWGIALAKTSSESITRTSTIEEVEALISQP